MIEMVNGNKATSVFSVTIVNCDDYRRAIDPVAETKALQSGVEVLPIVGKGGLSGRSFSPKN